MTSVPLLYRVLARAARGAAPLAALAARPFGRPGAKLARGVAGRKEAHEVLAAWGRDRRDPDRAVAWIHAPSVGEGLAAQAVIGALRVRRPELQVAFTHFSPSAEALATRLGADVHGYLPWDVAGPVRVALASVRPSLLAFTKTEVWPALAHEAMRAEVAVAVIAAVVPPRAGRLRWPARALLASTWRRISIACAVASEDAERLVRLGVPAGAVHVTGDPGVDSASGRAEDADPAAPHLAPFNEDPAPTVVAGSTWPEDEAVLMPALAAARRRIAGLRVIFAPHEPTAEAVAGLLSRLDSLGWKSRPLSAVESRGSPGDAAAVVVDRVGVLAHLYAVADVAYVGGGFGAGGLHSVLEPAAAGAPIVFGPRHERASAATSLVAAGGARVAKDAEELAAVLFDWLDARAEGEDAGRRAFAYIESHRGAAERTATLLAPFLNDPRST